MPEFSVGTIQEQAELVLTIKFSELFTQIRKKKKDFLVTLDLMMLMFKLMLGWFF
jgi:hypothetical protein